MSLILARSQGERSRRLAWGLTPYAGRCNNRARNSNGGADDELAYSVDVPAQPPLHRDLGGGPVHRAVVWRVNQGENARQSS